MIKTIFLDLDGVIVDFVKGIKNYLGEPPNNNKLHRKLYLTYEISKEEFIQKTTEKIEFWLLLEKYEWADELINYINNNFENIAFMSSTSNSYAAAYGKTKWMNNNLSEYKDNLILCSCKHLLANENTLLIDDTEDQTNNFVKYGGNSILFPQEWNCLNNIENKFDFIIDSLNFHLK